MADQNWFQQNAPQAVPPTPPPAGGDWFTQNAPPAAGGGDWFTRNVKTPGAPPGKKTSTSRTSASDEPERPGPARPPMPAALSGKPDPNATDWQNYMNVGAPDKGIVGTILNMPREGVRQIERGLPRLGSGIAAGGLMTPGSQARRDVAGGLSDVFRGTGETVAPVAIPAALVTAPVPTLMALGMGAAAGWGADKVAQHYKLAPEYAALLSDTANVLAGGLGPKAVGGLLSRMAIKPNAAIAELTKFADENNIPINAATRTGIERIRRFQMRTAETKVAAKSQEATQAGLRATAEKLRGGAPVTKEQAGVGAAQELRAAHGEYAAGAKSAYTALEEIEADPANQEEVVVGTKRVDTGVDDARGNRIFREEQIKEKIGLPVRIADAKAELAPVAAQIEKDMPLTDRQASTGLSKLNAFLEEKDVIPATTLDKYLSDVKSLLRNPRVSASSKRVLHIALDRLEPALGDALAKGGPDAVQGLEEGRRLTEAKYAVERTMKGMGVRGEGFPLEPVKLYRKFAANEDANIGLIREVKKYAPGSLPAVGRAMLEGLFDTALGKNGVLNPKLALDRWGKIGDQTKALMFSPEQITAMDRFFRLAELESRTPRAVPSQQAGATAGRYRRTFPLEKSDVIVALPEIAQFAADLAGHHGPSFGGGAKASAALFALKYGKRITMGSARAVNRAMTRNLSRALWNPETARALTEGVRLRSLSPLMSLGASAATSAARNPSPGAPSQTSSPPPASSPRPRARASAAPFTPEMKRAFEDAGAANGITPSLLRGMATVESAGDPNAVSNKGAGGLMQFMPETAQQFGVNVNDPVDSIKGAARYMRQLLDMYGGDTRRALAAYNAGPGKIPKTGPIPAFGKDYAESVLAASR